MLAFFSTFIWSCDIPEMARRVPAVGPGCVRRHQESPFPC